jgi:hypothetical protein
MRSVQIIMVLSLSFGTTGLALSEEDPRYFKENGITYREVREKVRWPVAEMTYEEREQTVYRQQTTNTVHQSNYTVYVPITEYRWEAYRTGVLNPFVPTSTAYRWVPYTRWEPRTATVSVPVTHSQWVPEKQTVKVPVRTLKFVEKEQVRRIAVAPSGTQPGSANTTSVLATRPNYGGTRLDNDPPRYGTGAVRR